MPAIDLATEPAELLSGAASLRRELAEMVELVSHSAPLTWAATGDVEAAHKWEKLAAERLRLAHEALG